jgi:DNA-binding transcriptional ArsR family regulator
MSDAGIPPISAFAALADATRCRLVSRLSYGPATAGQLAELVAMSRPAVSQHVKVLREAGVVRGSREGKFIWYELDGEALVEAEHWLRTLVDVWAAAPARRTRSSKPTSTKEKL